jgi:hypothetical protein
MASLKANNITDFNPPLPEMPLELKPDSEGGIGIKPVFVTNNMNQTYLNRGQHLNNWIKTKLLRNTASRIKINNSIVVPTQENLVNESAFTIVDYERPNQPNLEPFLARNEPVKILNTLDLVTLSASGDGLNCAFHSFLQAISSLFRALDRNTKNIIAYAFRFEYIKYVIINVNGAIMSPQEKSQIRDVYSSGLDDYDNPGRNITNLIYFDTTQRTRNTPVNFIELNSFFFGYNVILYTTAPETLLLEQQGKAKSIQKITNPIYKVNDTLFICNRGGGHFETIGYKDNQIYLFVFKENSAKMNSINTIALATNTTTIITADPNSVKINNQLVTLFTTNERTRTSLQTENTGCLIVYCFNTLDQQIYGENSNSLKETLKSFYRITEQEITLTIPNFCFMVFDYCENKKNTSNPIKIYLVLNFEFKNSAINKSDLFFLKDVTQGTEEYANKTFDLTINQPITKTHTLQLGKDTYYHITDSRAEQERLKKITDERLIVDKERQEQKAQQLKNEIERKEAQLKRDKEIAERKKAELETKAKEMGLSVAEYFEHIESEKRKISAEERKNNERQNLVKDYYKKINQNAIIDNTQLKINKLGEMKLEKGINAGTNQFDIDENIQNFINNSVIKKGMFVLVNNEVYMIQDFGSIIVDRIFEKDYLVDTIIIFYSVEKHQRANIITELLKKYNKEYDVEIEKKYEQIKNVQENSSIKYNEKLFREILIDVNKTQKHIENVKIDFVFNENINPVNITEFNFIQDINLVEKFVKYRKLEIIKYVRAINYTLEVYKLLSYLIDFEEIINSSIEDVKKVYTIQKIEKEKLLSQHKKSKEFLDDIVISNKSFFLNTTLCRFKILEKKLNEIKNRVSISKI